MLYPELSLIERRIRYSGLLVAGLLGLVVFINYFNQIAHISHLLTADMNGVINYSYWQ